MICDPSPPDVVNPEGVALEVFIVGVSDVTLPLQQIHTVSNEGYGVCEAGVRKGVPRCTGRRGVIGLSVSVKMSSISQIFIFQCCVRCVISTALQTCDAWTRSLTCAESTHGAKCSLLLRIHRNLSQSDISLTGLSR
jgi:hypothetical protein